MGTDLILELLPVLVSLITNGVATVSKIESALKQSGEMTPEQEKELDDHIAALRASPAWQQQL
jgi:hypothetical protein